MDAGSDRRRPSAFLDLGGSLQPALMPHADFVHLRVHSAYSLSEGAIKADKIAALAQEPPCRRSAITDTGNLFGALEFSQACAGQGRAAHHRLPDRARARGQPAPAARPGRAAGPGRDGLRQPAAPVLGRLPRNRSRPEAATPARPHRRPCRRPDPADRRHPRARSAACSPRARSRGRTPARRARRGVPRPHRRWNCTATACRSRPPSSPA